MTGPWMCLIDRNGVLEPRAYLTRAETRDIMDHPEAYVLVFISAF